MLTRCHQQFLLLGGATNFYRDLYLKAIAAMKQHIFYRPMTREGLDILLAGDFVSDANRSLEQTYTHPRVQHLGCFAGGIVALAGRVFAQPRELDTARRLVSGCLWAYQNSPAGIMPEIMWTAACPRGPGGCAWDEGYWHDEVRRRDGDEDESTDAKPRRLRLV